MTASAFNNTGRMIAMQSFKASGTFTPNAATTHVRVRAWAAGGGGGTTNSGSIGGPGGGSGCYVEAYFATSGLTPATITIGAGGAGGGANNGTAPVAGDDTSFGTTLIAKGGAAAQNAGGNPGAGGSAAGCTVPAGGFAIDGATGGYINGLGAILSAGAGAFSGLSQSFPTNVVTVNGIANTGAGGQGGNNAQNGGAGASGLMIIEEFS